MKTVWLAGFLCMSLSTMAQLRERLDSVMRSMQAPTEPGTALLVVVNGKTIIRNGYGLSNTETKARITSETNFRMASVSKQFTAMGILLLEKDGKLSVDDPLLA
jgi:CubicO group peptidase (beta-lactamase class C family)